jgi:hypothetical protein
MEFATIPFEDIMKRLFHSNHDSRCFKKLASDHLPEQEIRPAFRKYGELRGRQTKGKHLEALAKACLRDSKYRDFECFEEVILNSSIISDVPRRSFDEILGHMEKEKQSYPAIAKARSIDRSIALPCKLEKRHLKKWFVARYTPWFPSCNCCSTALSALSSHGFAIEKESSHLSEKEETEC